MANNMRIIYNNVADTAASVAASTTAGSLVAANLLTDIKTEVHRSTAKTVTFTFTWSAAVIANAAALPFCSLTSTATARVKCYAEVADASPAVDSGSVLCCGYAALGVFDWGAAPLGVNAFSYGGGTYARVYFTTNAFKKLTIEITDNDNTNAYLEHARAVIGQTWSPTYNPDYGARVVPVDTSKTERNDAGDLRVDRGPKHRVLPIDLNTVVPTDRPRLYDILWGNGASRPVFISLFPEDADVELEQSHQIYGRLTPNTSGIAIRSWNTYGAPLEVEEI